jgi:hypothetical protein
MDVAPSCPRAPPADVTPLEWIILCWRICAAVTEEESSSLFSCLSCSSLQVPPVLALTSRSHVSLAHP